MNHWTHILAPAAPASDLPGRVHILSDEIDPATQKPASHSGPKAPAKPAKPAPDLSWPGPNYKPAPTPAQTRAEAMAPVLTTAGMSYADAVQLRIRHMNGQPVNRQDLVIANHVVAETRQRAARERCA